MFIEVLSNDNSGLLSDCVDFLYMKLKYHGKRMFESVSFDDSFYGVERSGVRRIMTHTINKYM